MEEKEFYCEVCESNSMFCATTLSWARYEDETIDLFIDVLV